MELRHNLNTTNVWVVYEFVVVWAVNLEVCARMKVKERKKNIRGAIPLSRMWIRSWHLAAEALLLASKIQEITPKKKTKRTKTDQIRIETTVELLQHKCTLDYCICLAKIVKPPVNKYWLFSSIKTHSGQFQSPLFISILSKSILFGPSALHFKHRVFLAKFKKLHLQYKWEKN